MSWRQLCLPVLVRPGVAPLQHALQLLVCPGVEVDRFDLGDVRAHAAVDTRAPNAYEDTEVPAGPSGVYVVVSWCARPRLCWRSIRLFLLQSEHVLLPSSFTRFLSVARFCSARSAAGLGRRDIVGVEVVCVEGAWSVGGRVCDQLASKSRLVAGTQPDLNGQVVRGMLLRNRGLSVRNNRRFPALANG
jgi:hypothetical protein